MKNNQTIFRSNGQWWVLLFLWGIYVCVIFLNIQHLINNPIPKGLIFLTIIWIMFSVLLHAIRFILTIDDEFVKFKMYLDPVKIQIMHIKEVSVEKMSFFKIYAKMYAKGYECRDFTRNLLKIRLKNGKIYHIAIKSAQKIKEEIEKRMLTTNKI